MIPQIMKAIQLTGHGGLDKLVVVPDSQWDQRGVHHAV